MELNLAFVRLWGGFIGVVGFIGEEFSDSGWEGWGLLWGKGLGTLFGVGTGGEGAVVCGGD